MARNGSGSFSLYTPGNPVSTGTTIDPNWANNTLTDIATALTQSLSADGQTPVTADLQMTGFKHTNVANATARNQYCTAGQAQDNTFDWLTTVAGTDTITASAPISMNAYAAGQTFRFASAGANTTTSVTLNVNAIGAKAVTKLGSTALAVGDIPSGAVVEVVYDGTRFQIVGLTSQHAATADSATSATTATNIAGGASGSLPYQTGAGATSLLAKGTNGDVLTLAAGVPAWATMAASLTANGYQKLPSGLIVQWGSATSSGTATNNVSVTWPVAFPTAALITYAVVNGAAPSGTYTVLSGTPTTTTGSFTTYFNGSISASVTTNWLAIGY